jgi:NADH-quinone oxidoreductase subunit M
MITFLMIGLLCSGILAWWLDSKKLFSAKIFSLLMVTLLFIYLVFAIYQSELNFQQLQMLNQVSWISAFNIEYAIAVDQLSLVLIFLTLLLTVICILVSWYDIAYREGFFYFNLLSCIAGIVGVFSAVDLFLFFFFWEVMLLPMTAIIAIWGHEGRHFAAIKFFIFTQVSSLLMLIAIIFMAYFHQQQTGELSFLYQDWLALELPLEYGKYLMLGFFIAFAVKLPLVPVHSWLPDAHTQAPTAGSVLLAGVLLKTGAYGLIRFVIFLFPQASENFSPIAATLAVFSILYGAKMAFAQTDMKRLIAYSSISHMGFVMLALFSFNSIAYQGAIVTMIAHGLSSAALFSMAGMIYQRIHSREFSDMGGFWQGAPRMGGFGLAFAAAAFGLPGLANFIGEFLSLLGAYQRFPTLVILAALGLIGSAIYAMVLFQSTFQGKLKQPIQDLSIREIIISTTLFALLLLIGIYPQVLLQYSLGAML